MNGMNNPNELIMLGTPSLDLGFFSLSRFHGGEGRLANGRKG